MTWDNVLLAQIDAKIAEGGGWARIRDLPGGSEYVWDLVARGVLEESGEFVRRAVRQLDQGRGRPVPG